jgi:hypothetical protein
MDQASMTGTWPQAPWNKRGLLTLLLAMLIVGPMSAGCSMVERDRRAVALQAATNTYHSALRWGYEGAAFELLHPDARPAPEHPALFSQLRVTGYDVVQRPTLKGDDSATQVVVIDYLFEDNQIVKRLTDRQVWRWDDQTGCWWLQSGLPPFRSGGAARDSLGKP